jgi:hypothetical protein
MCLPLQLMNYGRRTEMLCSGTLPTVRRHALLKGRLDETSLSRC